MLLELHIRNFAIIDDLVIPFAPGFNVITGETGAGKSIIIEALGLVLGDRVAADVVRSGSSEAEVIAVFENMAAGDGMSEIIVRRTVAASGRSRSFVGGVPVSLSELKATAAGLLEISSQHEHQQLANEETHLEFVDRFGGLADERIAYSEKYESHRRMKEQLAALEKLASEKTEQREFISYQLSEIEAARLKAGEDEELERERNVVRHAAKLMEAMRRAEGALYSSELSIQKLMSEAGAALSAAAAIDDGISPLLSLRSDAEVLIVELSRDIRNYLDKMSVDPGRLDEIESRLFDIRRLKKKYGGAIEDVLKKGEELRGRLSAIDSSDSEIERLGAVLEASSGELKKAAARLSRAREKAALELSSMVQRELAGLGLKKSAFAPGHRKLQMEESDGTGADRFCFLVSMNPGEPLRPLSQIASGGELSRIMLAVKRVLMDKAGIAAAEVFDEVDVGIGGAVAEVVGRKLKEISATRQVICITHLPQVASFAAHHIAVTKMESGGRTVTRFAPLKGDARLSEIARMLGGVKVTKAALEHAREMMKENSKSA
jgi:DNA repair protein RecN (Recombination protein N)